MKRVAWAAGLAALVALAVLAIGIVRLANRIERQSTVDEARPVFEKWFGAWKGVGPKPAVIP